MSQTLADGSLIKPGTVPDGALASTFVKPVRQVATSGLATGGGDLSADRTINVPKAAGTDVTAGTDDAKAVTSKALSDAGVTAAAIAAKVPSSRNVNTSGLATGGGALSSDLTINVPKAASTDVSAGTDDTKAITSKALHDSGVLSGSGMQVDTNTSATATNFTVGTYLLVITAIAGNGTCISYSYNGPNNAQSSAVYVANSGSPYTYTTISAGGLSALSGTWRARGGLFILPTGNSPFSYVLMQRVA